MKALCAVALLAGCSAMAGTPIRPSRGHILGGVPIRGAGGALRAIAPTRAPLAFYWPSSTSVPCVPSLLACPVALAVVPYANLPGRGIYFLLQDIHNGTRSGKLCDFGGRREEADADTFATAAREFCEETSNAFGDEASIAERLRTDATVRILNRQGRYVCFFLKVDYLPAGMLPDVDATSDEPTARDIRWWRADQLIGSVGENQLLERMLSNSGGHGLPTGPASSRPTLSAFHRAVFKTLSLENANPHAHERWYSTVTSTIAQASNRRAAEASRAKMYADALAAATCPPSSTKRGSRRGPLKPQKAVLEDASQIPWRQPKQRKRRGKALGAEAPTVIPEARDWTSRDIDWSHMSLDDFRP